MSTVTEQELEYIRQNTRAIVTGEGSDAEWDNIEVINGNLPNKANATLLPGDTYTVINDPDRSGAFVVLSALVTNPFIQYSFQLRGRGLTWVNYYFSIYGGALSGATLPNDVFPYITKYDTFNDLYNIQWTPSPKLGYHHGVIAEITNPTVRSDTQAANGSANILALIVVRQIFDEQTVNIRDLAAGKAKADVATKKAVSSLHFSR